MAHGAGSLGARRRLRTQLPVAPRLDQIRPQVLDACRGRAAAFRSEHLECLFASQMKD